MDDAHSAHAGFFRIDARRRPINNPLLLRRAEPSVSRRWAPKATRRARARRPASLQPVRTRAAGIPG
jgi:hypothetical protein